MEPDLSAAIVPVPDAEPLVDGLRHELDPSAAGGVPPELLARGGRAPARVGMIGA